MADYTLYELFTLGGHGMYVWGSFLICLVAFVAESLSLRQSRKSALRRLLRLHTPNNGKSLK